MVTAGFGHSGQVAFDVGHKDRYADTAEMFSQNAQGDGFASAGGSGDQPVAIRHTRQNSEEVVSFGDRQGIKLGHGYLSVWISSVDVNHSSGITSEKYGGLFFGDHRKV